MARKKPLPEHLKAAYDWTDAAGELCELRDTDEPEKYAAESARNFADNPSGEVVTESALLELREWLLVNLKTPKAKTGEDRLSWPARRLRMSHDEWRAKGRELFGDDKRKWRFVCPVCRHKATVAEWQAAGAAEGEVGFSCIGRRIEGAREAFGSSGVSRKGPCNYAGGGLFRLNPVVIEYVGENGETLETQMFAFAPYEKDEVRP